MFNKYDNDRSIRTQIADIDREIDENIRHLESIERSVNQISDPERRKVEQNKIGREQNVLNNVLEKLRQQKRDLERRLHR